MHNSLTAWNEKVRPVLTARQTVVFNAVRELGTATMHEVRDYLRKSKPNIELHQISGRFGEMRDKGWLIEYGTDRTHSSPRTIWKVTESLQTKPQQTRLFTLEKSYE